MQYYKLNNRGTKWIKTNYNPAKRTIKLYDNDLKFIGIGLF
jgi:hypothetical protein